VSPGSIGVLATQRRYKEDIESFVEEYLQEAKHNRRVHNIFQAVIIVRIHHNDEPHKCDRPGTFIPVGGRHTQHYCRHICGFHRLF
jgi:hypothetical protein